MHSFKGRESQRCGFLTRLGINGNHALAEEIKQRIKVFLCDHLKLTLSEEKTHITNPRTEEAFFLGTTLKIGNGGSAKVKQVTNWTGKTFKRRTTGWETVMKAPLPRLIKRLNERAFVPRKGSRHQNRDGHSWMQNRS